MFKPLKNMFSLGFCMLLLGCTTGHLVYVTPEGVEKTACATEYTWQPSVDKFAVEYILAYCAKKAVEQGNTVKEKRLLTLDLSIAQPPISRVWTHELAKELHQAKQLTDKEYGYILAYLDLGLADKS